MPRGIKDEFWANPKTVEKFLELCDKANKPSVDWDKFHKLDKRDWFKNFSIFSLSSRFRKFRLIRSGLCWQCGKRKPSKKETNSLCTSCREYFRKQNNSRSK